MFHKIESVKPTTECIGEENGINDWLDACVTQSERKRESECEHSKKRISNKALVSNIFHFLKINHLLKMSVFFLEELLMVCGPEEK